MAPPLQSPGLGPGDDGPSGRWGETSAESFDIKKVIHIIRRRRKVMAATFVSVVAIGMGLTFATTPIYQSTATLLVNTSSSFKDTIATDLPILSTLIGNTRARSQETQIEVMKSKPVAEAALKALPEHERRLLSKYHRVTVTPVSDTEVISVSVASYDPNSSAALANEICNKFIERNQNLTRSQFKNAALYIDKQLADVGASLNKARAQLREFKQKNNTVDLSAETASSVQQIAMIRNDLRQIQGEKQASVARYNAAKATASGLPETRKIPSAIVRRPVVEELKRQLTALQLQRITLTQEFTDQSPEVREVDGRIASVQKRLNSEAQTEIQSWNQVVDPVRQQALQDIAQSQGRIWAAQSQEKALVSALQKAQNQLAKVPEKEFELSQISTDMQTLQQIYQMLNEKYQTLRISESADTPNANIVGPAQVPTAPITPNKSRNLIMSILLGSVVALMLGLILDRLDGRLHSEDDVRDATGLPVLAHIPNIADSNQRLLLHQNQSNTLLLETYRMLRTNIEFASIDQPIRSLVITSSQPNEGKTLTSTDLAVAIAMDGKKVILVDADLRRPSVHRLFNLSNAIGFTNVVMGTATLEEALQPTSMPNLWVLCAGVVPPNPPELLNSKAARSVMSEIFVLADFTVIDTPPSLLMVDAAIAASVADASLIVVSAQDVHKREVGRTAQMMNNGHSNLLGVVLNKVSLTSEGYYGYYGYSKSYQEYFKAIDEDSGKTDVMKK